jgi:hypothetical protein
MMVPTCTGDGRRLAHEGRKAGTGEAAHSVAAGRVSAADVGTLSAFVNIHAQSAWNIMSIRSLNTTVEDQKPFSESYRM